MKNTTLGNKIIVIGCSGSGKSVFSRRLAAITGLPLTHLDNVWWREDRTHISREAFDRELAALLAGERWIIDGNYSRTVEPRFIACDTAIFLDYDEAVCMDGIRARVGRPRSDIPWTESTLDPELVKLVESFRTVERPAIYALMEKHPDKQAIVFRTRAEAEAWLDAAEGRPR